MSGPQPQLAALLGAGIEQLSLDQEVTFQTYSRTVLPIDGYVFWTPTTTFTVQGALHHTMEMLQNEDETLGLAGVLFTTQQRVVEFDDCPINSIYVATLGGFRYAFSRHQGYFGPAQVWHYQGQSVYPAMASQLLDPGTTLDPSRAVVSNSLPLWLSLNGYQSPYVGGFSSNITLYPSFAVPANLPPPYGAVHIPPESTRALQSVPRIQRTVVNGQTYRFHDQLMADRVRVTLYGLQHNEAMDFFDCVLAYSMNVGGFGLMNTPAVTDGKRSQVELQALAMQKVIDFEISYQQSRSYETAMLLIQQATATFYVN